MRSAGKVDDGDVILTFAYSHVVAASLLEAVAQNKQFRVVVVDARPELEGKQMLQVGSRAGGFGRGVRRTCKQKHRFFYAVRLV